MVSLEAVRAANKADFQHPLVAVFIGATSGIGEYSLRALAETYSKQQTSLRVYVVGRSESAANKIFSDCTQICPHGIFKFVKAEDVTLIRDVDRVSAEIIRLEQEDFRDQQPRIDLLVQTQGQVRFGGREETKEGLDRSMSLNYYSRIRFTLKLMPLLLASDQPARIISIFGAGLESNLIKDDLSLRKPKHYSLTNQRNHVVYMTTMAFEHLAKQYPQLTFMHAFPGVVITPAYTDPTFPGWFKLIWKLLGPVARRLVAITPQESGQRTLFLGTKRFVPRSAASSQRDNGVMKGSDGVIGSGAYAVGANSEVVVPKADYVTLRKEGFEEVVWKQTMRAYDVIEAGKVFTD